MPKSDQDDDVETYIATIEKIIAEDDGSLPEPVSTAPLLQYRAANDNAERSWLRWLWIVFLLIAVAAVGLVVFARLHDASANATLTGQANVQDGDTLEIASIPVRLEGIDAPELRQTCRDDRSTEVYCGKLATNALARMIGGKPVTCELLGQDRFGRHLGSCSVGEVALNANMVREGWALASIKYSDRFVDLERAARTERVGIWRWSFDKPWDWRLGISQQAAEEAGRPDECAIKGNVANDGERIYHMPFHAFYGRTRIDEGKGERWFCSEEEAQAAGWRRALR